MMIVLAVLLVSVGIGSVLSEVSLLQPCRTDDIECLSRSTETFLEKTHKGIPDYNILAIDPLVIPSLDIDFPDEGVLYKNRNVTVTGLRNQKISDFRMDTTAKSVVLTTKVDLDVVSDCTVVLSGVSKTYTGHYTSRAKVLGTATYNYELKTIKGVEYFEVGPETITCKIEETPQVQLNPEAAQEIAKDPHINALGQAKRDKLRTKGFCKIVEKAYESVIHNIRAAAKILPASGFFNNLQGH